ncbi:phosphatidylethanolamine-binding protein [Amylostereum chailletii]|nr:phosphatidylethanolamine-binding protein [Amylostereum chailletii]
MFFSAALALSLLSLVNAQASLEIAAIEAHFSGAGIVPSLLTSFVPSAVLNVSFSGLGAIQPGQALTKDQVAPTPSLSVTPANSSVSLDGSFTLVMADASVVGTDETKGQTRHWLVNGVTLTGSSPLNVSTDAGLAVTTYAGPAPPAGEGPHRHVFRSTLYVLLLLPQPATFSPPQNLSTANVGVSVFNLNDYISSSNLGQPIAGMYFTVAEGTTTASLPATQAVNSATLAPASASGTSSASSSAGTASPANAAISTFVNAPLALLASAFGLMML